MSFFWVRVTLQYTNMIIIDISAIVLTATAFIAFNHAKNKQTKKKYVKVCQKGRKVMFEFWKVKQLKRRRNELLLKIILEIVE